MKDLQFFKERVLSDHFLEEQLLAALDKDSSILKGVVSGLFSLNETMSWGSYFLDHNMILLKQHLYICGRIDEYEVEKYNERFFDYGIGHVCNVLLSDSKDLIDRYVELRYRGDGKNYPDMDIMVAEGELPIWCHTIFMIVKEDWAMVERNLDLIKNVTLPKVTRNPKTMRLDYEFFKGVLERDKNKLEQLLAEYLTPQMHKKRNDDPLLSQYISIPALGYAKLAWMKRLEVEVDSPLVSKELLPIQPNPEYFDTYPFLKNYPL